MNKNIARKKAQLLDRIVHILQMISVHYLSTSEVAAELAKDQSASSDAPYGLRIYHRVKSVLHINKQKKCMHINEPKSVK
jgi:hypothetical protein